MKLLTEESLKDLTTKVYDLIAKTSIEIGHKMLPEDCKFDVDIETRTEVYEFLDLEQVDIGGQKLNGKPILIVQQQRK